MKAGKYYKRVEDGAIFKVVYDEEMDLYKPFKYQSGVYLRYPACEAPPTHWLEIDESEVFLETI